MAGINEKSSGNKCGFCSLRVGHILTNCPSCNGSKTIGYEYNVSKQAHCEALILMVESAMPVEGVNSGSITGRLSQDQYRMHAIIHRAYWKSDGKAHSANRTMSSMCFNVSLINSDGEIDKSVQGGIVSGEMVVSGVVMSQIVSKVGTGTKSKPKYVYNNTWSSSTQDMSQDIEHIFGTEIEEFGEGAILM